MASMVGEVICKAGLNLNPEGIETTIEMLNSEAAPLNDTFLFCHLGENADSMALLASQWLVSCLHPSFGRHRFAVFFDKSVTFSRLSLSRRISAKLGLDFCAVGTSFLSSMHVTGPTSRLSF
jgi:hypothetical protein